MRGIRVPRVVAVAAVAAILAGCTSSGAGSPGAASPTFATTSPPPASMATPFPTVDPTPTAPSPTSPPSGPPAGWYPELRCAEEETDCRLHLIDGAGRDADGWPVEVGDCSPKDVSAAVGGVIHVACTAGARAVVHAFDLAGKTLPGWPVKLKGELEYRHSLAVGPDGTAFVAIVDPERSSFAIHALGPDGVARAGWPRKLPGEAQGFTLAPDGTVVGWWYEPRKPSPDEEGGLSCGPDAARTKYTMIGRDGKTLPGWPVTSIGWATAPVVTEDRSIVYTSATGKVWGHDRSGEIIEGWPYRLSYQVAPELRPDGNLLFAFSGYQGADGDSSDSEVIVLTPTGQMAAGWPYRTSGALDAPPQGVCLDCCGPSVLPHATSDDGTLYLAPWTRSQAEIVALDADGTVVDGWPYRLPAGWRVADLAIGPAGTLDVGLTECAAEDEDCYGDVTRRLTLTPAGDLVP